MIIDETVQRKVHILARKMAIRLPSQDTTEMAADMEQAGLLRYHQLEKTEHCWLSVKQAMTNEWLRWTIGVKASRAKNERRAREQPDELLKPEAVMSDKNPSVEQLVEGSLLIQKLLAKFKQQKTSESYERLFEQMLLQGEGNLPNGLLASIGTTPGNARFRRDRIKKWLNEILGRKVCL